MSNNTKSCNQVYSIENRKVFTEFKYGFMNETLYDAVNNIQ